VNTYENADTAILRRIARRVEDILEAARDRESKGQSLALDIDARFRLQDMGAVQFQLASAILEEAGGLRQEEVVSELLSLGLASVLRGAAKAAQHGGAGSALDHGAAAIDEAGMEDAIPLLAAAGAMGNRVLN
jgi:hypothetical protein